MKDLLRNLPVFAGLADAALDLLQTELREHRAAAGEVVVREGEPGNRMFLVAAGELRVCKGLGTERETEIARLGRLDFFGEMCIVETLGRSASVIAVTETSIFSLSSGTFFRLYSALPAEHGILLVNLARDLSRRLRRMDDLFAALQGGLLAGNVPEEI